MASIPNISTIKELLSQLQTRFSEVGDLISAQIRSVVHHDLAELAEQIEEQITANAAISGLEESFKQELVVAFNAVKVRPEETSLTQLLPYTDGDQYELSQLRDQLRRSVIETQDKQQHLVQLLQFAQDHLGETLRAIYRISDEHGIHYQASGQKVAGKAGSRMINKTI